MIRCSACGTENKKGAEYCTMCGSEFEPPQNAFAAPSVECPNCRQICPPKTAFCDNCGKPLKKEAARPTLPVSAADQKTTGIRGVLIVVIIGMCVTIILNLKQSADVWNLMNTIAVDIPQDYQLFMYTGMIMGLIFAFSMVVLFVLMFKKKSIYPKIMIGVYVFNIVYTLLDGAWAMSLGIPVSNFSTEVMRSLFTASIWIPYFILSKRVKNTFVN